MRGSDDKIDSLNQRPDQDRRGQEDARRCQGAVERSFRRRFAISRQEGDQTAGDEAPPVRPVVDPREKESEEDKAHHPSHRLTVNLLSVETSPALAVVKDGAYETAEGCGGADGERDVRHIGEEKAG